MNAAENKMQARIVTKFHNEYNKNSVLFASLSELLASPIGSKLRAMGMQKSFPDLTIINNKDFYALELKVDKSRHDKKHLIEQAAFIKRNYKHGWFVTTEEDFFRLVDLIEYGAELPPSNVDKVLDACNTAKANSISWKLEDFNIFPLADK